MKRLLFFGVLTIFVNTLQAQTSYTIYDNIIFYDGYAATVDEPVPSGIQRINNARYTTKLTEEMVANLSEGSLSMDVTIGALCDNYDRLGEIFLAFVPEGETEYDSSEVQRIEIARIITPFMNKNISPTEVPYHFTLDNISELFSWVILWKPIDRLIFGWNLKFLVFLMLLKLKFRVVREELMYLREPLYSMLIRVLKRTQTITLFYHWQIMKI